MRDRRTGFRFRVFLAIVATASIFTIISVYAYYASTALVLATVEESAASVTGETSIAIEEFLRGAEVFPRTVANGIARREVRGNELLALLRDFAGANPSIYGTTAAFEPFAYDPLRRDYAPYFHESPSGIRMMWLGGKEDYRAQDWYRMAKEGGKPLWTEPYFDTGAGEVAMCSYVVPMYREDGGRRRFRGVVTADITLDWLKHAVVRPRSLPSSHEMIVSRSGRLISYPLADFVLKKTIFDLEAVSGDPGYGEMGRRMLRGERGFVRLKSYVTGKPSWVYFSPIGATGWSVALVAPEDELLAGIRNLNGRLAFFCALTVLFLAMVLFVVSRSVTKPLALLSAATGKISEGNLDEPVPAAEGPAEVITLALCLEKMRRDLQEQMSALAAATAREERIASELRIARNIQVSFLPKGLSKEDVIAVHAVLEPAREIGGDLYDYFHLDENHLLFVIGDVSDKGVPAALFMAATVTTIRVLAEKGLSPGEILTRANRELCRENDELMFVTMICGVLDLRNGEILLANAGHPPPVLLVPQTSPAPVHVKPGLILGISEVSAYTDTRLILPRNGVLLLFTDGVTESPDRDGALLGAEGVLNGVAGLSCAGPEAVVQRLMEVVRSDVLPADDVAVLAVQYKGIAEGAES